MSEAGMWEAIRPRLKKLDPVRIENVVGSGTPDVNYNDGWIELKYLDAWPARENTPVRIDHFTPQQKAWLVRRSNAGGKAWLLLKVGKTDWLLFDGMTAARFVGQITKQELYERAHAYSAHLPTFKELKQWLLN